MFEVAEYRVKFHHERLEDCSYTHHPLAQGSTLCMIFKKKDPVLWGRGIAWCSKKDGFSRSVGRKISLARALEEGLFDKPTRTLFWEAYFKKRGKVG